MKFTLKKNICFLLFFIFFVFGFSFLPSVVFAQYFYGDGNYGSANYGTGNGAPSSNTSSSATNNAPSSCTAPMPIASPGLYEIDVKGTNATLYLASPPMPYSNYQISFGNGTQDEGYNVTFPMSNATGAIAYTVQHLQPSSTYSFKSRAINGCTPGNWSIDMTVTSGRLTSTVITKYYPSKVPLLPYVPNKHVTTQQSGNYTQGAAKTGIPTVASLPAQPNKNSQTQTTPAQTVQQPSAPTNQSVQPNQAKSQSKQSSSGNFWTSIINFFTHLF